MGDPIDRAALRALAAAVESDEAANTCGRIRCGFCEQCRAYAAGRVLRLKAQAKVLAGRGPAGWIATRDLVALLDALDAAERVQGEAIAHCRASGEPCWCGAHTSSVGDGEATAPLSAFPGHVECGRALDAAERERDQARADLRTYGEHRDDCHIAIWMRCADEPPAPASVRLRLRRCARESGGAMTITAEEWTAAHPEGTPVRAWPGTREDRDTPHVGTVRSVAWMVCGSLCAMVTGKSGGIHTAHIECDAKCDVCRRAWADERARRKRQDRNERARERRAAR